MSRRGIRGEGIGIMRRRILILALIGVAAGYCLAALESLPSVPTTPGPPEQYEPSNIWKNKGWELFCANGGPGRTLANCYINCGAGQEAVYCQACCDAPDTCPCKDGKPDK